MDTGYVSGVRHGQEASAAHEKDPSIVVLPGWDDIQGNTVRVATA